MHSAALYQLFTVLYWLEQVILFNMIKEMIFAETTVISKNKCQEKLTFMRNRTRQLVEPTAKSHWDTKQNGF